MKNRQKHYQFCSKQYLVEVYQIIDQIINYIINQVLKQSLYDPHHQKLL